MWDGIPRALAARSVNYHNSLTNNPEEPIQMSRKINQILDSLEKNSGLTREGRDWLILACDPFHDSDISLAGYPDLLTASTVVQLVKQQLQITVPTTGDGTVTSGSNWDCSIALFPNLTAQELNFTSTVSQYGAVTSSSGGSFPTVGGLSVSAGPQGNNLWPYDSGTGINATYSTLTPTNFVKGQGRVIGMAFEVVNTTADIYKQGQCTAWRLPTHWTETTVQAIVEGPPQTIIPVPAIVNRMPPPNIGQAQLLFGSRSWAALEGAYVVARQNSSENPALQPQFKNVCYSMYDGASTFSDTYISNANLADPAQVQLASDYYLPFDISGVTFTGLSYQTTLTVNVRWMIERIPGPQENDLVVLAPPSAPHDPLALELYCQCLRDMPPGVMLKMNPLGEWFANALGKVAEIAPIAGAALTPFFPGAAAIGSAVGSASNVASTLINNSVQKKKAEKEAKRQAKLNNARIALQKPVPLADSRSHTGRQ